MTKEEAQLLYEQSHDGTLRSPNRIPRADTKTLDRLLKNAIGLVFLKNATKISSFKRGLYFYECKRALKKHKYVKKLKGHGTDRKPYKLSTIFGDGEFLDMHYIFKNGEIPKTVRKNYCFSNCINASIDLAEEKYDSAVLTGIANFGAPFLHAVLQCWHGDKPQVFDFNYDLVMDQDLYEKLFSFEVLSKVSGKALLDATNILRNCSGEVMDYQLLLAYDDCIKAKKEELARLQAAEKPGAQKENFGESVSNLGSEKSDSTPIKDNEREK